MRDGCPIQPLGVRRSSLVGWSRTAEAARKRGAGGNGGASKGERTGTAVGSGCGSLVHGQDHAPQRPTVAAGSVTGHLPSWGGEPSPRPTSDGCRSRLSLPLPATTVGWLPHGPSWGAEVTHQSALSWHVSSMAHLTLTFREQASCVLEKDEAEA